MNACARCGSALAVAALAACSPVHDWRDVRPVGTSLALQMPCRPVAQQRAVPLAGATVQLSLAACTAGGQTWALAHADMQDPSRVAPALAALRSGAASKLGATESLSKPLRLTGATPNVNAGRWRLHSPTAPAADAGTAAAPRLEMEMAVFASGTRVFQASALGEQLPPEAVDTFFAALRFVP